MYNLYMSHSKNLSVPHANLIAVIFYLNELQKVNLVTPSIATPFPDVPLTEEKLCIHKACRKLQQKRIFKLQNELSLLKEKDIPVCYETLSRKKLKLKKKLKNLICKFDPIPVNASKCDTATKESVKIVKNKKLSNKKSRERYIARRYKKKLASFYNIPKSRGVINLSSVELTSDEVVALELGYGFVPTPNNSSKEEELLVLEGFRFLDRLGKADQYLADMRREVDSTQYEVLDSIDGDYSVLHTAPDTFKRNEAVPSKLRFSQLNEPQLICGETKLIKSEFDDLNKNLIKSVKSKMPNRKWNLSKRTRAALKHLRTMVKENVIDIRKVDKGQLILIVDYAQRKLVEEHGIKSIARLCDVQESNWKLNRDFTEDKFRELYYLGFITSDELTAVTGLLAGGKNGKLKNRDGTLKFTQALSNKELFYRQCTPYIYPLFKAHKLTMDELLNVLPYEVHSKIPSRLVVGMGSCQLSRVQIWLESFLNPLSVMYGSFEFLKDSTDYLCHIEALKRLSTDELWDWDKYILFTIDVKALYPSVKFVYLKQSLHAVFNKCTTWDSKTKDLLVEIIMYTLENQQVLWNGKFYQLNQGLLTGAKHSVPLANILLTFIFLFALDNNSILQDIFSSKIKLWKRYIDDCTGVYKGNIDEFKAFYVLLQNAFQQFGLELTCETDCHIFTKQGFVEKSRKFITFLDIELYKCNGTLNSREHRKDTSASTYLLRSSAHPNHTFAGIVKSQLVRLRRICSNNVDFIMSVEKLKTRCLDSGYSLTMVDRILALAPTLERTLTASPKIAEIPPNKQLTVKLVVLSGTAYENEFSIFSKRMNSLVGNCGLHINIVKSTSLSISRLLFNNREKVPSLPCTNSKCQVCKYGALNTSGRITSNATGCSYTVDNSLTCSDGGIYVVTGSCKSQYTGKTVEFCKRCNEHFSNSKSSTVYQHKIKCVECYIPQDFEVTLVENTSNRGKYSLSEREHLWNFRIKGSMNVQKTLKAN